MRSFLFSFVIPAWNVAPYLPEAVESVLAQSVGFQENIQLILVNDGSDDDTGAICARCRDRHPDNVVFLDRPHLGVSAARNAGMAAATGRWLNFLDADDRWDRQACAAARAFFTRHPDITIVSFPYAVFGRRGPGWRLDHAFRDGGIADILTDINCRVSSACTCFIRTDIARRHAFDERLTVCEDLSWVTKQVLDERRFGMCGQAKYRYRKRPTWDSTMDRAAHDSGHVLDTLELYQLDLLRYAEERYGRPPTWAQHTVMVSLGRQLQSRTYGLAGREARRTYRALIRDCLVRIEDFIILATHGLGPKTRIAALALKHGVPEETVRSWIEPAPEGGLLRLHRPGAQPVPFVQAGSLWVDILDVEAGQLTLSGTLPALPTSPLPRLTLLMAAPDGSVRKLPCALHLRAAPPGHPLLNDAPPGPTAAFALSLPLDSLEDGAKLRALLEVHGTDVEALWLHGPLSPLQASGAFLVRAGCLVGKLPGGRGLTFARAGLVRVARREAALIRRVAIEQGRRRAARTACVRLAVRALRRLSGRPIWLFGDRAAFAGDNGEALFAYLMACPERRRQVWPFFLLNRDSPDWPRLRRIGPVVACGSGLHKLLVLAADKIISSHIGSATINPLDGARFRDLCQADFVFLQHGVIKDDLSAWLYQANRNLALFVTSAERERQSILQGNYGYDADQVILTGLPRHDGLLRRAARERPQGLVVVMPTWRQSLVASCDPQTALSLPNPNFVNSVYFRFWNGLLNHPRLLAALRQHGYCLRFVIHPQSTHESAKFEAQEPVTVLPRCDYQQTFCEAALLVTDYSSVAFDFALLKKPVIYAQFDREAFYAEHYVKGYFSYDRDGFGPVCLDLETTVDAVLHALETDCVMASPYPERVDAFFGPQPENRCQAVLDAITRLGRRPR